MIAQYTWDLRRQQLRRFYDDYIKKHDTPPQTDINLNDLPPSILGSFFMCDGQPAVQSSNMIAIDNRRFYCGDTTSSMPDLFPDTNNGNNDEQFNTWFTVSIVVLVVSPILVKLQYAEISKLLRMSARIGGRGVQ
eukprot:scaffold179681_cov22-Cyclotella_meneghiniana.AAC.1